MDICSNRQIFRLSEAYEADWEASKSLVWLIFGCPALVEGDKKALLDTPFGALRYSVYITLIDYMRSERVS